MSVEDLQHFIQRIEADPQLRAQTFGAKTFMQRSVGLTDPKAIRAAQLEDAKEFADLGKKHGFTFTAEEAEAFFSALKKRVDTVAVNFQVGGRDLAVNVTKSFLNEMSPILRKCW